MKNILKIVIICLSIKEVNAQKNEPNKIAYYSDFDIFSLSGIDPIDKKRALRKDKYVAITSNVETNIVTITKTKTKQIGILKYQDPKRLLYGQNFVMHRIPNSYTSSTEKMKFVGKDSLLIFQEVTVSQGIFQSLLYRLGDTIFIERFSVVHSYDSVSLGVLKENSKIQIVEKFYKEGEKWVVMHKILNPAFIYKKTLKSKNLRYIDILAWNEQRRNQIK